MKSSIQITNEGNTIHAKGKAAQALFDALTNNPDCCPHGCPPADAVTPDWKCPWCELDQVKERLERMTWTVRWLLPMARAYAHKNPHGANQQICNDAEALIKDHNPSPRPDISG